MQEFNRKHLADLILAKIATHKKEIKAQYDNSKSNIGYFFIDDLLPVELTNRIYACFPKPESMMLKKSLKEYKYVAAQMNNYDPILEEAIYAFQDNRVVAEIEEICGLKNIMPDENLYAGGISLMGKNNYLNPHLDNSHDKDRNMWRVLNLLFYVSPNWKTENGGHLELWPNGVKNKQITIESKFNRLAVMATHDLSWHSVNQITVNEPRCCVSNYYFSPTPLRETDAFHVTTFRGRPDQVLRDWYLQFDNFVRMSVRKVFKKGIVKNPHVYKK